MADRDEERPILDYAPPPKVHIPRYRKLLAGIFILAGAYSGIAGLFAHGSRRQDCLFYAAMFLLWGVAIRYLHVRLW